MKNEIRNYVILDRLQGLGDLDHRPMFEGFGLFHQGHFFGLLHDGRLYLKTWPDTVERYRERGMEPFSPSETTRLQTYFEVPPDVLGHPEELQGWAREAIREEAPAASPDPSS